MAIENDIFLNSSAAEHSAVNRRVVGSNPTRGAKKRLVKTSLFLCQIRKNLIIIRAKGEL